MAKVTDKDMEKYISGGGKMFKFRDPRNGEVTEFIDNASNRGKVKRIVQRYISIRGDGTHQDYLKKKAGTAEKVGAIALFAIPGGGFIRLGTMGTKAAANALKAARAKFPKGKVVTNPSAAQVRNAKPVGSVPAGGSRTKPTSKDKPTTVRQDKPRVRVPAVTRGGASSKRMPTPASGSGRPMSTRQMLDKVRANAAKRTKPPKPLTAAQRAAIAGRSAAPAVKGAVSDTSKATTPKVTRSGAASKRMPVVSKKTTPKISASAAAEKRNIKTYGKPLIPSRSSALVSLTGKPAETGAAFKRKRTAQNPHQSLRQKQQEAVQRLNVCLQRRSALRLAQLQKQVVKAHQSVQQKLPQVRMWASDQRGISSRKMLLIVGGLWQSMAAQAVLLLGLLLKVSRAI